MRMTVKVTRNLGQGATSMEVVYEMATSRSILI